jgi:hypothetical protein
LAATSRAKARQRWSEARDGVLVPRDGGADERVPVGETTVSSLHGAFGMSSS